MTTNTPSGTLDIAQITAAMLAVGVTPQTAAKAAANLSCGEVQFLVVSGKLASGKDTVAPAVFAELGITGAVHGYFADALKNEIDVVIADMRAFVDAGRFGALTAARREELAELISAKHGFPVEQAAVYTGRLLDQVRSVRSVHARSRTAVMRRVLQFHGTDVRRAQDENYWVKQALRSALVAIADGQHVYFTDARFPNEVSVPASVGAYCVRIDITAETQHARLFGRDGKSPDPQALTHASETALDDFDGFAVRVSNDGPLASTVGALTAQFRTRTAA